MIPGWPAEIRYFHVLSKDGLQPAVCGAPLAKTDILLVQVSAYSVHIYLDLTAVSLDVVVRLNQEVATWDVLPGYTVIYYIRTLEGARHFECSSRNDLLRFLSGFIESRVSAKPVFLRIREDGSVDDSLETSVSGVGNWV